jgi:hypothetical protein
MFTVLDNSNPEITESNPAHCILRFLSCLFEVEEELVTARYPAQAILLFD